METKERAGAINGVPGRFFNVVKRGDQIASQVWKSEARPVEGYVNGAKMAVKIRHDDECNNGHESFAITATVWIPGRRDIEAGGCLHTEIAEYFPELAPLIKWHLCGSDKPMHYVANATYHADAHGPDSAWIYYTAPQGDPLGIGSNDERLLVYARRAEAIKAEGVPGYRVQWDEKTVKTRNLGAARKCAIWPEATDAQLMLPKEELTVLLNARLPGLMADFRAAIESCGLFFDRSSITEDSR